MDSIVFKLAKTNNELAKQVKGPWLYFLAITLFCVIVIVTSTIDLFIFQAENEGIYDAFISIIYIVLLSDIILIILRIQSRSFIEPYQLNLFPVSQWKKFLFHMTIFLLDYKTLIYLSAMGCFMLFFINHSMYLAAIYSLFFWLLLLIIVLTWTATIYGLFSGYLDKMGNRIQYIGLFFLTILLGLQQFDSINFEVLPVINHTGNALYGLWVGNTELVWTNLQFLLGSIALPLLLLIGISIYNKSR